MKIPAAIPLLMIFIIQDLASQPVSIMVKNINDFEILEDGTKTGNWYTQIQQTYDSSDRLVLERFYDLNAKQQVGFAWYFYDKEGRLKSVENYDIDKNPRMLKQIEYNSAGDTSKVIEYLGNQGNAVKTAEKTFHYSDKGQLIRTRTVTPANATIENVSRTYKADIKLPVKISIVNTSSSPFNEKARFVYNDSTGLPQSAVYQVNHKAVKHRYSVLVTCNIKGNPIEKRYLEAGKTTKRTVYEYGGHTVLKKYYDEDSKGKLTSYHEIETYWHKANLDVKSYFNK